MNDMANRFPVAGPAVITPEILSLSLRIDGPPGPFLIKGVAREVKPWAPKGVSEPRCVYGTLALGEHTVRFRTGPNNAPSEGEAVVLSASLEIKPAKVASRDRWTGGYEALLVGEKVGGWTPDDTARRAVQLKPRADRLPLQAFFRDHAPEDLVILVSENADTDIQQAFTTADLSSRPRIVCARYDDEAALIKAAREAAAGGAKALALARGGSAGLELIANSPKVTEALIALELPFYSGQGHGRDVFLVDKHADESFATPSVLAAAAARAIREAALWRREREELAQLRAREEALRLQEQSLRTAAERDAAEARDLAARLAAEDAARSRRLHADGRGVSLSWPVALSVGGAILALVALVAFLVA